MLNPNGILTRNVSIFRRHPRVVEIILAPLALVLLFLFAFRDLLHGDKSIATFQDNTHFYLPLFSHISRGFAQGAYPYWIDSLMGGLPLYDNPNFSLIYPFYFFHYGLYTNQVSAILQLHYVSFLHIFIAYVNFYILLRVLRLRPVPALLGASIFAFSVNTVGYAIWVAIIASYSWFPLVIAGTVLVLENRRPRIGIMVGALSLTLLILATPSQSLIHAIYLIGILFVFSAIRRWRNHEKETLRSVTKNLIVMGALTIVLAAPVLVTVLVDMGHMIRFAGQDGAIIGYGWLHYHATLNGQMAIKDLLGTLLPYFVPSIVGHPFVGLGAVFLALFAVFRVRSHWIVLPLMLVTLYALLSSTGSHLGLSLINYCLPLLNKFREPDRHLFVFVFGISALAAFGFSYLFEALTSRYRALLDLKHLGVVIVFLALLLLAIRLDLPYIGLASKTFILCLCGLAFLLLALLPLTNGRARHLIAATAAFLIILSGLFYPRPVPKLLDGDYFSSQNLTSHKVLAELAKIKDIRNYRIIFDDKELGEQKWAMNASYYGLRSFYLYCNTVPYRQFEEMYLYQRIPSRYSLLLGAKYYLCGQCDAPPLEGYVFQQEINGYKLYVNDQALPKYSVIGEIAGEFESTQEFLSKVNENRDLAGQAYVDKSEAAKVQPWFAKESPRSTYEISEEYLSPNRIRLRVNTNARAMFLLNEYFTPAWQASVNRVRVDPVRINLNQIGVVLEKGSSIVEFEYRPWLYVWLLRLQQIILLGLMLYLVFRIYKFLRTRAPIREGS